MNYYDFANLSKLAFDREELESVLGISLLPYSTKAIIDRSLSQGVENLNDDLLNEMLNSNSLSDKQKEILRSNREAIDIITSIYNKNLSQIDYEAEIPAGINQDKLAQFINLLLKLREKETGERVPTYSELHSLLSAKFPKEKVPSKNTIRKYLTITEQP